MLGLTDGDFEGNLLVLFDNNVLGEANGDFLELTDVEFEGNLLGLCEVNVLGDESKDGIDGNESVSPAFFSHQTTLNQPTPITSRT